MQYKMYIDAITRRKEALLYEVEMKFLEQRNTFNEERRQVQERISECKGKLESAAFLYNGHRINAVAVLQSTRALLVNVSRIDVSFAPIPHDLISRFGKAIVVNNLAAPFDKAVEVTTFAGSTPGFKDGIGCDARMFGPCSVCYNPLENCLYFTDSFNHVIRKITPEGAVIPFGGTPGDEQLKFPHGIGIYKPLGILYVASSGNHEIKKISSNGQIVHFAGKSGIKGNEDGMGHFASFNNPCGITVDQQSGNIYVSDYCGQTIRRISPQGYVSTIAGIYNQTGYQNGHGFNSLFNCPWGLTFDMRNQSLIVCDYGNNKLRKISLQGEVSTLCEIPGPTGVVVCGNGIFLVTSHSNHKIFKVFPRGIGTYEAVVLAGGKQGCVDGSPFEANFSNPEGIEMDEKSCTCYIAEYGNSRIRKITLI